MIVVGINVAPRFDVLKQADKEARYLADLKGDLATDIEALDNTIASNGKKSGRRAKYIGLMPQLAELPAEEQTRTI